MFVVFEGIDGSGKTTLSNHVAKAMRERGLRVEHVREGGKFASNVTQAIRELGRDARNMTMVARTEFLLFVARDAQLLEEATRPALGKNDLVLADRYFYTAEVLARHGRGLTAAEVDPVLTAMARGVEPDLVVLVDVDPHVARARRRVAKIVTPDPRPGSRKGLTGVGLQHRLREGYRELAARDPGRWLVVDNTSAPLEELERALVDAVDAARTGGPAAAQAVLAARASALATPAAPAVATPAEALLAFLAWIDRRAAREPGLAAYFLAGLAGPGVDERRESLAARAPEVVAAGLRGLTDPVTWRLRRALAVRLPGAIARSLGGLSSGGDDFFRMRDELADASPDGVAASLDGRDEERAWALRERLWPRAPAHVVTSLKRNASARAWALRERWLASLGEGALGAYEHTRTLCESIAGLDDERAWRLRKQAREVAPIPALGSIAGLASDTAWKWRERNIDHAPKTVLRTITGLDDPRAWALRGRMALRVKEALDSLWGMDDPRAWTLRETCQDVWPSTAAKSLGPLARGERGAAFVARQLARHGHNVSLLKHASAIALSGEVASDAEPE